MERKPGEGSPLMLKESDLTDIGNELPECLFIFGCTRSLLQRLSLVCSLLRLFLHCFVHFLL